jgi:hypothetical protein
MNLQQELYEEKISRLNEVCSQLLTLEDFLRDDCRALQHVILDKRIAVAISELKTCMLITLSRIIEDK